MREKIESYRGQISFILKKETLSVLERNLLKNCDYQLQCMYQYFGEKDKVDSFLFALDNINKITSSTTGVNNKKAQAILKSVTELMSTVKSESKENTAPRGEKRSANTATPGSSPKSKRHLSFRAASLFGTTEQKLDSSNEKTNISLGQHRKK